MSVRVYFITLAYAHLAERKFTQNNETMYLITKLPDIEFIAHVTKFIVSSMFKSRINSNSASEFCDYFNNFLHSTLTWSANLFEGYIFKHALLGTIISKIVQNILFLNKYANNRQLYKCSKFLYKFCYMFLVCSYRRYYKPACQLGFTARSVEMSLL